MKTECLTDQEDAFVAASLENYLEALQAMRQFAHTVVRETDKVLQDIQDDLPTMFGVGIGAFKDLYVNPNISAGDWNGNWAWLGKRASIDRENSKGISSEVIIGLIFSRQEQGDASRCTCQCILMAGKANRNKTFEALGAFTRGLKNMRENSAEYRDVTIDTDNNYGVTVSVPIAPEEFSQYSAKLKKVLDTWKILQGTFDEQTPPSQP